MKIFDQNKYIFFLTFYLVLSGCINESKTDRSLTRLLNLLPVKKITFQRQVIG